MIAIGKRSLQTRQHEQENAHFVKLIPAIRDYVQFAFRNLRRQDREDAICEVLAYAFCAFRRLAQLGRLDVAYATPLARFGVARFRCRRATGSKLSSGDVLTGTDCCHRASPSRQVGATIDSIVGVEMLGDNRRTPVPDQVCFRLDFQHGCNY